MMRPVVFKSKLFADPNFSDHPRSRKKLLWMLEALTRGNQEFLQDNPNFPSLYDPMRGVPGMETVEYLPEVTTEEWLDIETALDEGGGDCFTLDTRIIVRSRSTGHYEILSLSDLRFVYQSYEALSYNFDKLCFEFRDIVGWTNKGRRSVLRAELSNGSSFVATADHGFWGLDGRGSKLDVAERCLGEFGEGLRLSKFQRTLRTRILQAAQIPALDYCSASRAEVYLAGIYAAEGHHEDSKLTIGQKKLPIRAKIETALDEAGVEYCSYEITTSKGCYAYHPHGGLKDPVVAALRGQGNNSVDMTLPMSMLSGDREMVRELVEAYGDGDAYHPQAKSKVNFAQKSAVYATSSDRLAEQLRLGMLLLGRSFHLWHQLDHQGVGENPIWRLYEYNERPESKLWKRKEALREILPGLRYGMFRSVVPAGRAYVGCIEVEGNHNFVLADGTIGKNCEDLASWRCAELRNGVLLPDGRRLPPVKAMPHIKWRTMGDKSNRFHALVELPDGTIEDPSERLGMAKYNGYLSGKMPKDQVVAMLLREAEGAAQVGNLRASDTLKLRARQYWEENKDK